MYKPKGNKIGSVTVAINGQEIGEMKTGQKIICKVFSEGIYAIDISKKNNLRVSNSVVFSVAKGYAYYVKLYTNDAYELMVKKEGRYVGERIVKNRAFFHKKKSDFLIEEDLNNPFVKQLIK